MNDTMTTPARIKMKSLFVSLVITTANTPASNVADSPLNVAEMADIRLITP